MVYLVDGAGCKDSYEHCLWEFQIVRSDFIRAGFVINEGKSHFQPVQIRCWLALIWNCESDVLQVPPKRFVKLKKL